MKIYFDHEKLDVYREAINFCGWVGEFLASISAKAAAKDQLDRASTSIPLNIAEGNGKFSAKDRARFFEMARGSALENLPFPSAMLSGMLVDARPSWSFAEAFAATSPSRSPTHPQKAIAS
ncbi:MAG: four helix bundle protein [Verrucomicrobia bacterium]|nr:MAG: four helix bundle protein [Verrucomicrobiota bacterium]